MTGPDQKVGFFEELKRRNVFRVAVAYLITAWLLLQVADIVLENIYAPDWVIQAFMLALAAGLPLALIFAWAFEMTPEGIKREKDVDRSQSITHKTGRKLDFTIIAILAVAVVMLLLDRFRAPAAPELLEQTTATEQVESAIPSIAVLPFVNMSSDPEQEFFSDGISEEILNALARVKELKVAGRTSSFAFKGKEQDLREIGQALGVESILEGSVRKSGNMVRITAQLVQVDDGFHLWSETYDRELDDVFVIQDEIATAILQQLKAALVGFEPEAVVQATTRTDSEVYDQYLLAKQRIYERKRLSIESAVELLDKAIARDPDYAPAYAQRGIAALLLSVRNYGEMTRAESDAQGKLYLDKALQLDPELAEGWAGLGLYHVNRPGESTNAIEVLTKALEINPNLIDASNWLTVAYSNLGENTKAMEITEQMIERDPLYPPGFGNAIAGYNLLGMQEKSWALLNRIRPYLPGDPQVLQAEASTWLSLGKPSKALPLLESALQTQPNDFVMRNYQGWALINTGQFERAVESGLPWHKLWGLEQLERREEAKMLATELASEGNVQPLIFLYGFRGEFEQLIDFVQSRWTDLDAFQKENPDGGGGYGVMLEIARAHSALGNVDGFEDAMSRVRAAHDRSIEQGVQDRFFFVDDANYYVLAGDRELAIELLAQAVDLGVVVPDRFEKVWPVLSALGGDPEFEAIQTRMFEHLNAERAALGLEPIST
ncbi:MAG TPA: hypothetical protein VKN35_15730 [Xanthomonadales bacterium]|nr:hypothetical protein [Xanthomonadales bacterium]